MLSFINMGNRKHRRSGSGNRSHKQSIGLKARNPTKRVSRDSGSFASPGDIGRIVERRSVIQMDAHATQNLNLLRNDLNSEAPLSRGQHSQGINLDLTHDSLLNSFPKEFLQTATGGTPGVSGSLYNEPSNFQVSSFTFYYKEMSYIIATSSIFLQSRFLP